jgi:hypothetical protein
VHPHFLDLLYVSDCHYAFKKHLSVKNKTKPQTQRPEQEDNRDVSILVVTARGTSDNGANWAEPVPPVLPNVRRQRDGTYKETRTVHKAIPIHCQLQLYGDST